MKPLAPIVLFVYNRPWHTEQTLHALMKNELADQSVLYIYADGPKENAGSEELQKIEKTREIIRQRQWCKETIIIEKNSNAGLADSIISGVTEVVNNFGKIIVLEDDIVTSKGFLKYMNDALAFYEENEKVFHISGYMYPHNEKLPATFFFNVPLCWGWGTWKRTWNFLKTNTGELIEYADKNSNWKKLNKFGGNFLGQQLTANSFGEIKTWFIKWHISVLMQNGYTLYPGKSLVNNIGFDDSGIHNGISTKYAHGSMADTVEVKKISLKENTVAADIIKSFYKIVYAQDSPSLITKLKRQVFMIIPFRQVVKRALGKLISLGLPESKVLKDHENNWGLLKSLSKDVSAGKNTKINTPYQLDNVRIGDYTYVAINSNISYTSIGKFSSLGPNLLCGSGIHAITGISTSPMFYSTRKQNGTTLSKTDKILERKQIKIGNDVFIGANVTILDGLIIGDGAIIGAGAVVSKDIPAYAIAVGCPIKIIRYRFNEKQIHELLRIKWWDFQEEDLKEVEKLFFEVDAFIDKYQDA